MTFFKLNRNNFEFYTMRTHPRQIFVSGSGIGVTGSVPIFANYSDVEFVTRLNGINESAFADEQENYLPHPNFDRAQNIVSQPFVRLTTPDDAYRDRKKRKENTTRTIKREAPEVRFIGAAGKATRNVKEENVWEAESSVTASLQTMMKKSVIVNTLMPYYRPSFPTANFNFTNYHCLNFFTASSVHSDTALLYPTTGSGGGVLDEDAYTVNSAFTFEFWINPRYAFETDGTILHLSGNYAISLVTGTLKFDDGTPSHYGIKLQLSRSADIPPSASLPGIPRVGEFFTSTDNHLTFTSSRNALQRNHWHHVAIEWALKQNRNTGSFIVDGSEAGIFVLTSAIGPSKGLAAKPPISPNVLVVGNYYATSQSFGLTNFFNDKSNVAEGVANLIGKQIGEDRTGPHFTHPLNAEIHEIRIWNKRRTKAQLNEFRYKSLKTSDIFNTGSTDLKFYLPPFFTKETNIRDVKFTPYTVAQDSTTAPFNTDLSFRVGGFELNLENYTRDFAKGQFPRLVGLTGVLATAQNPVLAVESSQSLDNEAHRKRNLTVLPNDNGLFSPNFELLKVTSLYTGSAKTRLVRFTNDIGNESISEVSLRNLISTGSLLLPTIVNVSGASEKNPLDNVSRRPHSPFIVMVGSSPEYPNGGIGEVYAVAQRVQDVSSNEICWFNISNIYYDREIKPQSFAAYSALTGSQGYVNITLKDDGYGNIYRADCETKQATWNSVGNIFYSEGLVLIKNPILRNFGKDKFEIGLSGTHNVHVHRTYIKAPRGMVNSSSQQQHVTRDRDENRTTEHKSDQVNISGILLYNKDFNVVAKVNLAQIIEKTSQDSIVFKITQDF